MYAVLIMNIHLYVIECFTLYLCQRVGAIYKMVGAIYKMVGAIYKVVGGYIQNIVGDGGSNIYEVLAALDIFKKRGNYKRESGILALASHTRCRHCFLSHVI